MKQNVTILKALTLGSAVILAGIAVGSLFGKSDFTKTTPAPTRFDYLVRDDFFAGFNGDSAKLALGMQICADTLAVKPNFAEAMVWQGSGYLFYSGMAYRNDNQQEGLKLWMRSLAEMDSAVKLDPDNLGVLIPRGTSLITTSQYVPEPYNQEILHTGIGDFEHIYELQKNEIKQLPIHPRGELLGALADAYHRAGDEKLSKKYFKMIVKLCKGSVYETIATKWLAGKSAYEAPTCQGCHVEG